jgi:hypothetical protein
MTMLPFVAYARGRGASELILILVIFVVVTAIVGLNGLSMLFWAYIALGFLFVISLCISMLLASLNLIGESDIMVSALISTALIVGYLLYINRIKPSNEPEPPQKKTVISKCAMPLQVSHAVSSVYL